ncbi:hypothetical protein W97_05081 [Coniosporium apollinis CBS 100218]|uniref:Uncharacterized protein n=1 Tax=Coniosporium apollinis (strain CBS 100218) TaxID=1168221 RepID=R7YVJ8_CONA1|nr:uncharacterized protein W97_05081 [Coniosporium apollinis CBS 100218]EON65839.1 hypothetical protein W97_05081 [Coniosporium apollinis CBS 100218]
MKEEGKPWAEINDMWEMITGKKPAESILPNQSWEPPSAQCIHADAGASGRTVRVPLRPPEGQHQGFEAKKTVEELLEQEKWNPTAAAMKELGTDDYTMGRLPAEAVQEASGRWSCDYRCYRPDGS